MQIYLFRHGETDWNLAKRIQGQKDEATLTKKGREQAHAIGRFLYGRNLDAIFTADLQRTRETAEIAASYLDQKPQELPSLRERGMGWIEGKIPSEYGIQWSQRFFFLNPNESEGVLHGGETIKAVLARIEQAKKQMEGENIAVISSGWLISYFINTLREGHPIFHDTPNAGYHILGTRRPLKLSQRLEESSGSSVIQ